MMVASIGLGAAFGPVPAVAQSNGAPTVFQVSGIDIDVTGSTAAQARDQALSEGQAEALATMLRRLTRAIDWQRLPTVRPSDTESYVLDIEIIDERSSDVRYLASLNVRFRPEPVRNLLRQSGVPFADRPSPPVLVMPLLRQGDATLLWEETNDWRAAWAEFAGQSGLVPMVVPFADIADMSAISANQALRGDRRALAEIAANYGIENSLVAVATLSSDGAGSRARVDVSLTRVGAGSLPPIGFSITAGPGEDAGALLRNGVETSVGRIEDAWISANVVQFGRQQVMNVDVRFDDLAGWVTVGDRLAGVAAIGRTRVISLGRDRAEMELTYAGAFGQLISSLALVGLDLVQPQLRGFGRFAAQPREPQALPVLRLASGR